MSQFAQQGVKPFGIHRPATPLVSSRSFTARPTPSGQMLVFDDLVDDVAIAIRPVLLLCVTDCPARTRCRTSLRGAFQGHRVSRAPGWVEVGSSWFGYPVIRVLRCRSVSVRRRRGSAESSGPQWVANEATGWLIHLAARRGYVGARGAVQVGRRPGLAHPRGP